MSRTTLEELLAPTPQVAIDETRKLIVDKLPLEERATALKTYLEEEPPPSTFERVIDYIGRSEFASANIYDEFIKQTTGEKPLSIGTLGDAAWKGFSGKDKRRYIDILKEHGMEEGWKRTILGFLAGTALDPLMYIPLGMVGKGIRWIGGGLKHISKTGKVTRIGKQTYIKSFKPLQEGIEMGKFKGADELRKEGLKEAAFFQEMLPVRARGELTMIRRGFEKKVPEIRKLSIDRRMELRHIAEKQTDLPPGLKSFEKSFIQKYRKEMDRLYELEHPKHLIKGSYLHNYVERIATPEARHLMREFDAGRLPAETAARLKGLITKLQIKPIPKRTLFPDEFFLGKKIREGTIQELNEIAVKRLPQLKGHPFFEEDLAKIWVHRLGLSAQNQIFHDNLMDFGVKYLQTGLLKPFIRNKRIYSEFIEQYYLRPNTMPAKLFRMFSHSDLEKATKLSPGYKPFKRTLPLKGLQGPTQLVDEIEKTYDLLLDEKVIKGFFKWYDKINTAFKYGVTIPWPSFHFLNLFGGLFNDFLYFVGTYGIVKGPAIFSKRFIQGLQTLTNRGTFKITKTGKIISGRELHNIHIRTGAGGGWAKAELGIRGADPLKSRLVEYLKVPVRAPGLIGAKIEDIVRMPILVDDYLKFGNELKAAKQVFKYHFNYAPEGLKPIEQKGLRRLLPFYVWLRNNIMLQMEQMYKQTGTYATLFRGASMAGPTQEEREFLPPWQKREFLINVPEFLASKLREKPETKIFLSVNIPIADALAQMHSRAFFAAIHPLIRVPIEMLTNYSLFFGNKIWKTDRYGKALPNEFQTTKAYPILKKLPPALQEFIDFQEIAKYNSALGIYEIRFEANNKKLYILRNALMGMSRAYYELGETMEKPEIFGSIWHFLSPFRIREINMKEMEIYKLKEKQRIINQYKWLQKSKVPITEKEFTKPLTEPEPILPPSKFPDLKGRTTLEELMK